MKILVVSNNYPSEINPVAGIFVYNLMQQFAKNDHEVTVISPAPLGNRIFSKNKKSYGPELCKVYRPKYISTSNKNILGFNTYRIGELGQVIAVKNVVKKNNINFDLVYAHFLSNGLIAVKALYSFDKPIVVAEGEFQNIDLRRAWYKPKYYQKLIHRINGFIAVSPQIKNKLIEIGVKSSKILVKPNAVNFDLFYQHDKVKMRVKYGLPLDKKLIIFVGRFVHDKGPLRLLSAVKELNNIGLIYVGSGIQTVESTNVVFNKKVLPSMVPELMSAADLFVLPTLHEGSCNAIVEAMACGLPIISSDIPEIRFQCSPEFSILIDPNNIDQIKEAILTILLDEKKANKMSLEAIQASQEFEIGNRAKSILEFLYNVVNTSTTNIN